VAAARVRQWVVNAPQLVLGGRKQHDRRQRLDILIVATSKRRRRHDHQMVA